MRLNEKHEVQRSEAFNGLTNENAFKLGSYMHFRNCQNETKQGNLESDDAIFQNDFLDDVESDMPKGSWSLQKDGSGRVAIIRNNVWKGFTAWHRANTQNHGSIYVGDGLKNVNFQFTV